MKKNPIKTNWLFFLKTATWILTLVSTFLVLPPLLDEGSSSEVKDIARFAIACLLAILFIPMKKWSTNAYYTRWYRWSITVFVLGIGATIFYFSLLGQWSVKYYHDTLVKGIHMTDDASRNRARLAKEQHHAWIDDETFVKYRAGQTQLIWPSEERRLRFVILISLYFVSLLLLSFFIAGISQAIYCYQSKT